MKPLLPPFALLLSPFILSLVCQPTVAQSSEPTPPPAYLRPATLCPTDLSSLSTLLVRDIPSYTNRVVQRSVADIQSDPAYRPVYTVVASLPDLAPLDIANLVYTTDPNAAEDLAQVFFTTLERQYQGTHLSQFQHYHWLFLASTDEGWHLAFMFSTLNIQTNDTPLPPRESSNSSVGKAIQLWLRDCRAGAVDPWVEPEGQP
jgi:hypothetical protein